MFSSPLLRLAEVVLADARVARLRIVTAESCTGGLIAALLTDRRMQQGLNPMYATPLLAAALLLGGSAFLGTQGYFGKIDAVVKVESDYLLLAMLSARPP